MIIIEGGLVGKKDVQLSRNQLVVGGREYRLALWWWRIKHMQIPNWTDDAAQVNDYFSIFQLMRCLDDKELFALFESINSYITTWCFVIDKTEKGFD